MRNLDLKAIWPESSGCEYYTKDVKAITGGKVLYIGSSTDGIKVVTVQCNKNECLRYCNLTKVNVKVDDVIRKDALIGSVHSFVKVEYCTSWQDRSHTATRVYNKTYYLQDPGPIFADKYAIEVQTDVDVVTEQSSTVKLTSAQVAEFSNNRGDNIVEFQSSNIFI